MVSQPLSATQHTPPGPANPPTSRARVIPIAVAQATGVLCGVLGVKVNSHLIPPALLGVYGVYLTLTPIGMWVVHAGLVKFVGRHWAGAPSRPGMLKSVLDLWRKRLGWIAFAAVAGAAAMAGLAAQTNLLLAWASLFLAASLVSFTTITQSALQAERAHWRDCLVSTSGSLTRTFLPPALLWGAGGALSALLLGFCLHAVLTAAVAAGTMRVYLKNRDAGSPPVPLDAAYRGLLFTSLAAVGWALAGLNRWIVAAFFGEVEAGYFTLAGGAAVVVSATLGAMFVQYFQPGIFAMSDASVPRDTVARRVDAVAAAYAVIALAAVGMLAAGGQWLIGPLISPAYAPALVWLLPAGCFGVATITLVFYQTLLLAGRREKACAPVEFSSAALLAAGCVIGATLGREWFMRWLIVTPLVPWLVSRPLARRYFFMPDAAPAPAPAR